VQYFSTQLRPPSAYRRLMFGSFSGAAMAVIGRAHQCAVGRGGVGIEAGDIVLGALSGLGPVDDDGLLALARWLTSNAGRAQVAAAGADPLAKGRLERSGFADRIPGQQIPFAESAIAAFRAAWKKARWDGRPDVDEFDLLTAAIEQPALAAARRAAGIDLDEVRAAVGGLRQAASG
jgi:hypothetical protein